MELDFVSTIYSVFLIKEFTDVLIFSTGKGDVFIYDLYDQRLLNVFNETSKDETNDF